MKIMPNRLRLMVFSAVMAALLCVLSPITLPVGALPMTLSVFALFLMAALSPVKVAFGATLVYLAVGAVGLPVFSSFTGGVVAFVSPSGGYLWGYLPAVLLVSFLCQRRCGSLRFALLGMLSGLFVLYTFGLFGFCLLTGAGVAEGLLTAVLPFLLFDFLKILLVLTVYPILQTRIALFGKSS